MDFLVALAVALVATPVMASIATRTGIVDHPGPLKVHRRPVAYLGGVAVLAAVAVVVAPECARLLVPLGLALAAGTLDDVSPRSVWVRVVAHVVIGAAAGWAVPFPAPAGELWTAVATIGMLNALNLLDGLDGLAAGVATVGALTFAALSGTARTPALALAGALVGFLAFNRPPARIYLGDGGAYVVGVALALLGALALQGDPDASTWAAVPLVVAVPVLDTAVAFARRIRAGRPLFHGDRSHVYDQLVDRGASASRATVTMIALQAGLALVAAGVTELDGEWAVATAIGTAFVVAGILWARGFLGALDDTTGAT